jgi:hypothetical protein
LEQPTFAASIVDGYKTKVKPEWEALVTYEDDDEPAVSLRPTRFEQWRSRPEPRNVTPSRELMDIAEKQRVLAQRSGDAARGWAKRGGIALAFACIPTPLTPLLAIYAIVALIFAGCTAAAAWNASTGAALAKHTALHVDA